MGVRRGYLDDVTNRTWLVVSLLVLAAGCTGGGSASRPAGRMPVAAPQAVDAPGGNYVILNPQHEGPPG